MSDNKKNIQMERRAFVKALGLTPLAAALLPNGLHPLLANDGASALKVFGTYQYGHGGCLGRFARPTDSSLQMNIKYPSRNVSILPGITAKYEVLSDLKNPDGSINRAIDSGWHQKGLIEYTSMFTALDIWMYHAHSSANLGNWRGHFAHRFVDHHTLDRMVYESSKYAGSANGARYCSLFKISRGSVGQTDLNDPSTLAELPSAGNLISAYNSIFTEVAPETIPPTQAALASVLSEIDALRNHPKLSSLDRPVLEAQIGIIESLSTSIAQLSCASFGSAPFWNQGAYNGDYSYRELVAEYWANLVTFAANTCDKPLVISQELNALADPSFYGVFGDYHQDVAHYCSASGHHVQTPPGSGNLVFHEHPPEERLKRIRESSMPLFKSMLDNGIVRLAEKLKNTPNGNSNLLEQSLLVLVGESGVLTHSGCGGHAISVGGANGNWRKNVYVDFQRQDIAQTWADPAQDVLIAGQERAGLPQAIFLNTICQAAGLSPEEYEKVGGQGYGDFSAAEWNLGTDSAGSSWMVGRQRQFSRSDFPSYGSVIEWLKNSA